VSSLKLGNENGGRGRGRIELALTKRKPKPPPKCLTKPAERAIWRKLWAAPVSVLWETDYEDELVLDLVYLRARLRAEGIEAPLGVIGQIRSLEDRLLLSPRARRVAGIVLVKPEPARKAGAGKASGVGADRRRQIVEGRA